MLTANIILSANFSDFNIKKGKTPVSRIASADRRMKIR